MFQIRSALLARRLFYSGNSCFVFETDQDHQNCLRQTWVYKHYQGRQRFAAWPSLGFLQDTRFLSNREQDIPQLSTPSKFSISVNLTFIGHPVHQLQSLLIFPATTTMESELLGHNNNCWFCSYKNTPWATECDRCCGLTISNNVDVERIKSYSSSTFNKGKAAFLFSAVADLHSEEEAAAIKIETGLGQEAQARAQAADHSVEEQEPILIIQILIVRTPTQKRFTVGTRASEKNYQRFDLGITHWANNHQPAFWELVNRILNLDVHSPVRKGHSAFVDHHSDRYQGWRQQV